jgi:hypothetical protein
VFIVSGSVVGLGIQRVRHQIMRTGSGSVVGLGIQRVRYQIMRTGSGGVAT